jgi:hypothetical protein
VLLRRKSTFIYAIEGDARKVIGHPATRAGEVASTEISQASRGSATVLSA